MRRIPCAFIRNEQTGYVTPQPAVDWFAAGLGVAHRKWDGLPYLLDWSQDGDGGLVVHRGVRFPRGDPTPIRFIQTSDAGAEEMTGWIQVGESDEAVMIGLDGIIAGGKPIEAGSYELCGPGIKGNHEGLEYATLLRHDLISYIRTPRRLDDVVAFMLQAEIGEGLVWSHGDQLCRLTRKDVGLDWPTE